jgi:hypothetical protein
MENLFVTATNLYSLVAIRAAINNGKICDALIIGSAALASIIYHLSETKHNMRSLCFQSHTATTLNVDRTLAIVNVLYFACKYGRQMFTREILSIGALGFLAMLVSESQHVVKLPMKIEKPLYMITHPIWHLCAFHVAYLLVKRDKAT